MSAAPRLPTQLGYGLRMSADDYLALGETHERYELIDGVVVLSPSPDPGHQSLALILGAELLLAARPIRGVRVIPDVDITLSPSRVYRPDLAVYGAGRLPKLPERLSIPPDLIIEILSPSSRSMDLVTKRDDYEQFGVGEYWVIDPSDARVRCWRRSGVKLVSHTFASDVVDCVAVPGLTIDLAIVRAAM